MADYWRLLTNGSISTPLLDQEKERILPPRPRRHGDVQQALHGRPKPANGARSAAAYVHTCTTGKALVVRPGRYRYAYLGSRSLYSSREMDANACFRFALNPDGGSLVSLMHLATRERVRLRCTRHSERPTHAVRGRPKGQGTDGSQRKPFSSTDLGGGSAGLTGGCSCCRCCLAALRPTPPCGFAKDRKSCCYIVHASKAPGRPAVVVHEFTLQIHTFHAR